MTTSTQPCVLTEDELRCLRRIAEGVDAVSAGEAEALRAKGMLEDAPGAARLTPAAMHALNMGEPGTVPGLDN